MSEMSGVIRMKGCPRCGGTLVSQSDAAGEYRSCLMCGYVREPERLSLAVARAETEDRTFSMARSRRRFHTTSDVR